MKKRCRLPQGLLGIRTGQTFGGVIRQAEGDHMAKRLATAHQLERLISERMRGAAIIIQRDKVYGWTANLVASPDQIMKLNAELQQVVAELQEQYELAD